MTTTAPNQSGTLAIDLIGNTPLVRLAQVTAHLPAAVTVAAKAEWYNPGGSVKDRPALAMIRDGIARGLLTPDKTILRRDERQHRHRLRDDRRGARLPGRALHARRMPARSASASCAPTARSSS